MITREHVQEAYTETEDVWLRKFLEPWATGQRPLPTIPEARSVFAWYVAGVLGQRIGFRTAQARRRALYTLTGTVNVTRSDVMAYLETYPLDHVTQQRLKNLVSVPDDANLSSSSGIGPWTIQNVQLMESITRPEACIPVPIYLEGDVMLNRRCQQHRLPDPHTWGRWRGLITWLLWR